MKIKDIKFFIGPVSKNIMDTIIDFSTKENIQLGVIPSRRQIDYDGGYVNNWNTKKFFNFLKNENNKNLIIERDHGGIAQGRYYDNGTLSLYTDAKYFDIIHIDPWYHYKNDFQRALDETVDNIRFVNKISPFCQFEIGTEETIYHFDDNMLDYMLNYLIYKLGEELFSKIVYCVIQCGTSLKNTTNTGKFDVERLKNMLNVCEKYGVLSKEHNGDYLKPDELKIRFDAGLSAINIAPEFGVYETDLILEYMTKEQEEQFFNICYNSKKWNKWTDEYFDPFENKKELIRICGHYQFSNPDFINMNIDIDIDKIIKRKLYNKLSKLYEI